MDTFLAVFFHSANKIFKQDSGSDYVFEGHLLTIDLNSHFKYSGAELSCATNYALKTGIDYYNWVIIPLIVNALEHGYRDVVRSPQIIVTGKPIEVGVENGIYQVSVSDNGTGIEPDIA